VRVVVVLVLSGCASVATMPDAGEHDLADPADLTPPPDLRPADLCVLGTGDHCGGCGKSCPPGMDDARTLRTCSDATLSGVCSLACRGEWYDIDGQSTNGCEAEDAPAQDSIGTALELTLPDGTASERNIVAKLYSDARAHEQPPLTRTLGRDDFYRIIALGNGKPTQGMAACLGIVNFPTDNRFEACITDNGSTAFAVAACQTALGGGSSVCVVPPAGGNAGTYYVRVRKLGGSHNSLQYALFLDH
jgi:hypothetical protein